MKAKIPKQLQGVLWSVDISSLDLEKDKQYIIHQILAYGRLEDLRWLLKIYSKDQIREVFTSSPEKDYDEQSFNFAKNILLDINHSLDKRRYVKTYPRIIR